jgi:tRNA 2-thiouridine synthesizing protein A
MAIMIKAFVSFYESQPMTEKTLNLRGLKCPLPALRTRKALSQSQPGDILIVECTDPLSGIDIPNLLRQTGDTLEDSHKDKKLLTFRGRFDVAPARYPEMRVNQASKDDDQAIKAITLRGAAQVAPRTSGRLLKSSTPPRPGARQRRAP